MLASLAKKGECGSFFGQSPKNEPPLVLLVSEAGNRIYNFFIQYPLLRGGF
ncbi:MAG: hypothetical protein U5L45_16200 [Saprospiraceae bacterium]|nr:hypothetical protein [Saprospiraceae bacterium]